MSESESQLPLELERRVRLLEQALQQARITNVDPGSVPLAGVADWRVQSRPSEAQQQHEREKEARNQGHQHRLETGLLTFISVLAAVLALSGLAVMVWGPDADSRKSGAELVKSVFATMIGVLAGRATKS